MIIDTGTNNNDNNISVLIIDIGTNNNDNNISVMLIDMYSSMYTRCIYSFL